MLYSVGSGILSIHKLHYYRPASHIAKPYIPFEVFRFALNYRISIEFLEKARLTLAENILKMLLLYVLCMKVTQKNNVCLLLLLQSTKHHRQINQQNFSAFTILPLPQIAMLLRLLKKGQLGLGLILKIKWVVMPFRGFFLLCWSNKAFPYSPHEDYDSHPHIIIGNISTVYVHCNAMRWPVKPACIRWSNGMASLPHL